MYSIYYYNMYNIYITILCIKYCYIMYNILLYYVLIINVQTCIKSLSQHF